MRASVDEGSVCAISSRVPKDLGGRGRRDVCHHGLSVGVVVGAFFYSHHRGVGRDMAASENVDGGATPPA